ncbi:MAG TPA: YbhB/YbcL family Raf kinase inhibitor-like protein [Bacteroidota bacterium]|jgi:Raf kinase inhibitor-like YbhB/YbcL family protein
MRISSSAFQDGKPIPTKYAHPGVTGGKNISLPLAWTDVPPEAKSFALSIVDPHPVANNWVHWIAVNIPRSASGLAEGASGASMPPGSKELYNTYGMLGYGGPEPPKGSGPHPYIVTLHALNVESLDLAANISLSAFGKALEGKIIASAKMTGIYER